MLGSSIKNGFRVLEGNWLRIIGVVFLCYIIKLIAGTLPVQGTIIINFDPLAVLNSETLLSLVLASVLNSFLFFIMVDYITNTAYTMRRRFAKACAFPFQNWQLLYKGAIVFFLSNVLLTIIGMMAIYAALGGLVSIAGGSLTVLALYGVLLLIFAGVVWLFLSITQAVYILYDDPDIGVMAGLKQSFSMMKGSRWPLLGLFLLMMVATMLGALLIGLGAFVSIAIFEVVRLSFYKELLQKRRREEWHAKVNG
ncbi:DUF975 family protein [Halobacillus kuroshimensis]|uniref:DUF975 family protein n=1 Tax=Halobacillus kuroshimensis TaxID=302481 RepID=A0ABS3DRG7_9BACI|nr:DUF975 family protein [Halobacillus kuroshimensis]MBN8233938.1 DUF975 family protein [Halobacillus kuroshimensis]